MLKLSDKTEQLGRDIILIILVVCMCGLIGVNMKYKKVIKQVNTTVTRLNEGVTVFRYFSEEEDRIIPFIGMGAHEVFNQGGVRAFMPILVDEASYEALHDNYRTQIMSYQADNVSAKGE